MEQRKRVCDSCFFNLVQHNRCCQEITRICRWYKRQHRETTHSRASVKICSSWWKFDGKVRITLLYSYIYHTVRSNPFHFSFLRKAKFTEIRMLGFPTNACLSAFLLEADTCSSCDLQLQTRKQLGAVVQVYLSFLNAWLSGERIHSTIGGGYWFI